LALGGNVLLGGIVLALGVAWFAVLWHELSIRGSNAMKVRVGDSLPAFHSLTTDGRVITQVELTAAAPALLVLYRGWWCPSSKVQLDDLLSHYAQLSGLGLKLFAGSVDGPDESLPMQEHVGSMITILGGVEATFLDAIGVSDQRGAPWYDRLWFGARNRPIAMPAAIAVGANGRIMFAERSTRVDHRPSPDALIASLTPAATPVAA
jgi:peroxiredoxin